MSVKILSHFSAFSLKPALKSLCGNYLQQKYFIYLASFCSNLSECHPMDVDQGKIYPCCGSNFHSLWTVCLMEPQYCYWWVAKIALFGQILLEYDFFSFFNPSKTHLKWNLRSSISLLLNVRGLLCDFYLLFPFFQNLKDFIQSQIHLRRKIASLKKKR